MTTTSETVAPSLEPFEPKAPELLIDPYPTYRRYREADPVHWGVSGLAGYPGAWYVFRYHDAMKALRDPGLGKERHRVDFTDSDEQTASRPPVPAAARSFFETARHFLVHRDPPAHSRLRTLMNSIMSPAEVESMRSRIESLSHELIDRVEEKGEMDFIQDFAYPLPAMVIAEMLGITEAEMKRFMAWSRDLQAVDLRTSEETWAQASRSIEESRALIQSLIDKRREKPQPGMLTRLVEVYDGEGGDKISEAELIANILFLYIAGAGFETTTGFLGTGCYALLKHPDQLAVLREDLSLLPRAVEEMLRYESPVQQTNRIAHRDTEIGGQRISRGDSVLVVLAAANRDPEVFADPDRFWIERPRQRHHAFGSGIHFCLGAPLARLEGEVGFRVLLERLADWRLADEAGVRWSDNAAIRTLRALPVRFERP